jgi:hypothetical protein
MTSLALGNITGGETVQVDEDSYPAQIIGTDDRDTNTTKERIRMSVLVMV